LSEPFPASLRARVLAAGPAGKPEGWIDDEHVVDKTAADKHSVIKSGPIRQIDLNFPVVVSQTNAELYNINAGRLRLVPFDPGLPEDFFLNRPFLSFAIPHVEANPLCIVAFKFDDMGNIE
jgi:hypothetical protein